MREFDRPIGRAWRRLRMQRFLSALVWGLVVGLLLTAVVIGLEKVARLPLTAPDWLPFAIAVSGAFLIALLVAAFTGPSRVDAAVAIDRAFHLNERLSTALTLPEALRATPAGRALIADAVRHVEGLDIASRFALRAPSKSWAPFLSGALAIGMLFVPQWSPTQAKGPTKPLDPAEKAVVARQAEALSRTIAKSRKDLDNGDLARTEKLLAEIEKAADDLAKTPPASKDQAMVELNKLTDALKDRQKQLGSADQINKQLQQMKDLSSMGPADDLAKDLARGDFQKAVEEIKKLQEKLASGQMSDSEKKELRQQLGDLKKQLDQLANLQERKKQLDEARKNGAISEQQYQQEMAKLDQQSQNLEKLQKLAQQLGQAQQAMEQGDLNKAAQALGMSQEQLQDLANQVQELEALDSALADLQDAKSGMSDALNQIGEQLGMGRDGQGNMNNGQGLGRGRGQGDRPEAPDDVAFHNTKDPSKYGKGKAVITGFGPPKGVTKGESQIDVQGELEAAGNAATEALSNQRVPNNVKKHVLGYFDEIRKGNN